MSMCCIAQDPARSLRRVCYVTERARNRAEGRRSKDNNLTVKDNCASRRPLRCRRAHSRARGRRKSDKIRTNTQKYTCVFNSTSRRRRASRVVIRGDVRQLVAELGVESRGPILLVHVPQADLAELLPIQVEAQGLDELYTALALCPPESATQAHLKEYKVEECSLRAKAASGQAQRRSQRCKKIAFFFYKGNGVRVRLGRTRSEAASLM